jgi:hypothetical protein
MTQQDNGGPAFPYALGPDDYECKGMTLREYAALQVLPAIITTCANDTRNEGETHAQMFARKSLVVADAFIEARKAV